jgi:hypothetical protein
MNVSPGHGAYQYWTRLCTLPVRKILQKGVPGLGEHEMKLAAVALQPPYRSERNRSLMLHLS